MKTATVPLVALINDSNVFMVADLYDIYLANGDNFRWTDADRPVEYPTTGTVITDLAGDPAPGVFEPTVGISRQGVEWTCAAEVQSLDITINLQDPDSPESPSPLYNGLPLVQHILEGLFDDARFKVYKAFFDVAGALVDVLLHFEGTVGEVTPTSSSVKLGVKSELDKLNIKMPTNLFQPGCAHAFLSEGCDPNPPGTLRASVTSTGALIGTPTKTLLTISGTAASNFYQLGVIHITSGQCSGQRRAVRSDADGGGGHQLTLAVPLPLAPLAGDTYSLIRGCARTKAACTAYSNLARFRGFPYVPRPEDIR